MGKFEYTIEIKAPLEKAFNFIADGTNVPQYDRSIRKAERLGGGPVQLGSKLRVEAVFGPRRYVCDLECTEFTPNKSFRDRQIVGPFKKYEDWAEFQKTETGTKWTFGLEYELPGAMLGKVRDVLGRRRARQHQVEAMRRAKEILESG